MDLKPHISRFRNRFAELEKELAKPDLYSNAKKAQEITREHSRLKQTLSFADEYERLQKQVPETEAMIRNVADAEMAELATMELPDLQKKLEKATEKLRFAILPPDENDSRNTIIEIRAGAGGSEAAIFASELYRMYFRFAEREGWKVETLETSPGELGGLKEVIFQVNGQDVFKKLRYESGVHRVQRVPATEAQGRIHTSTATVAVLPEAQEVDLVINPSDLRIEVCRSGGPGGQGVNTTDSAVQILHIPTGLIVRCQDGRSQQKNKEKALNVLRSRLLETKQREEAEKYAAHRRSQIGSGGREEKIRTYNFPQNRVTDHRIGLTLYNLDRFMEGELEEMISALQAADLAERLKDSALSA